MAPPESSAAGASSARDVTDAVSFIRQSAFVQQERVQTMLDAAILAVEQVQDKRLDILESGPEVSWSQTAMDFLLGLVLNTPLAGKIAQLAAGHLLQRAQSALLAKEIALRTSFLSDKVTLQTSTLAAQRIAVGQLGKQIDFLNAWVGRISAVRTAANRAEPWIIGIAKAAKATTLPREPSLAPTDTPGVALLDIVFEYAGQQRFSIVTEHSMMEEAVRARALPLSTVYDTLAWEAVSPDLGRSRDRLKRYFEMLIWIQLLTSQAALKKKGLQNPLEVFTVDAGDNFQHLSTAMGSYLRARLLNPATLLPYDTNKDLGNYLAKVWHGLDANLKGLVTMSQIP
jgi:hypothetical protein